ncbi:hypothetical protein THMIRHAT_05410 [Thiosulfativibrio zosterae]|uniref:diguanylate cyclase n=2 Tax=Thiosulfativibrio zosterae TaxID=2675053 RepID=A0A6F8PL30_9GAMM|nr:hypothetical protein THMIRHAT_05410 [Thiosulfativibrio zosterae]
MLLSLLVLGLLATNGRVFAADPVTNTTETSQSKPVKGAPLETVSLRLKWFHQFQFAGYYAALAKGFYRDEGLNVVIQQRDIQQNNIQEVLDGKFEYGIADSVLLLYQAQNAHLKIVAPIFQHSPQVFMTLKSSGIETPYQLEHAEVAFYQKDTDGFPLLAMFKSLNIKINLQRMVIKADPEMLLRNEAQAYPCYLSNEPFVMQQKGVEYNIINPMNYGIDFYGDMLFTNGTEAKEHPQRVEAFKRASLKGWEYALSHKPEIIHLLQTEYGSTKSYEHLMHEANALEEVIRANSIPLGTLDKGRLEFISGLFQKYGLSDKPFNIEAGIFEPEKNVLTLNSAELLWLKQFPEVSTTVLGHFAPIASIEKGMPQGIGVSYARSLEHATGLKLLWQKSATAIFSDTQKLPDLVMASNSHFDLNDQYHFSKPYFESPLVIATQNNEPYINDIQQLKNQIIAVIQGSNAESFLAKQRFPHQILVVQTTEEGLQAIATGKAKALIDAAASIGHAIKKLGLNQLQISGDTQQKEIYQFAVNKNNPQLLSVVNKFINSLTEADHQRLQTPWLKVEYYQKISGELLAKMGIPLAIILILILRYNRKLQTLNAELNRSVSELNDTQKALQETNEKLSKLSITDALTQVYNRTYIDQRLTEEFALYQRHQQPLSLLMIDLDFFKSVNDIFGHLAGDQVLIKMAEWCQSQCRTDDLFARWGGEEFMVLCRNSDLASAEALANRICKGATHVALPHHLQQSLSIGVTQIQPQENIETFISRADQALYLAKNQGRNQVISL